MSKLFHLLANQSMKESKINDIEQTRKSSTNMKVRYTHSLKSTLNDLFLGSWFGLYVCGPIVGPYERGSAISWMRLICFDTYKTFLSSV
jgi:hypothetical protein